MKHSKIVAVDFYTDINAWNIKILRFINNSIIIQIMKAGKVTEIIIFQCKICKTRLKVCKSQSVCKFPFSIFPPRSNFYVITVYKRYSNFSFIYIYNNKQF